MTNQHYLDKDLDSDFLKQGRIDPITGEKIEEGHTIVICAACKSAFFIESWEYLGENHCNQSDTLIEIPKAKNLFLEAKPLEYLPFLFKKGSYKQDKILKNVLGNTLLLFLFSFGAISTLVLSVLVGYWTTPIFGVLTLFGMLGSISLIMNKAKFTNLFTKKINPKQASKLALNSKKQALTLKKNKQKSTEQSIEFDDIEELNYSFNYINSNEIKEYHHYSLSLKIISKSNQKETYYTILHQDEMPKWSEFLEQLPYSLKVLNVQ